MSKECFYKVLNVSEMSSPDEIKKSYRSLSMKWHPDKNPDNQDEAKAQFQKINEAYETLSDPDKKQMYDLQRNNPMGQGMFPPGFPPGFPPAGMNDLNNLFANLFNPFPGMPSGGGMPNGFPPGTTFHGPGIRIFTNNSHIVNKPQPIQININISIEQVLVSTTIPIEIERSIMENNVRTTEKETLYIPIPKGIADGEIIILQDKGHIVTNNINNQTIKGEVKIFVKVENKTAFKRSGLDLIYDKKINLKEALCGFTFELKHLNGKSYTINNNAGSIITPGYRKIIPNMGLQRDEYTGNLIICFDIQFPEKLSEETVKKLSEALSI